MGELVEVPLELDAELKRGLEQVRAGLGITKTMDELEAMEKDES